MGTYTSQLSLTHLVVAATLTDLCGLAVFGGGATGIEVVPTVTWVLDITFCIASVGRSV